MGRILIGILAIGWGAVLIPAGLRRRTERGSFSVLGLGESLAGLTSRRRSNSSLPVSGLWNGPSHPYQGGPVAPIRAMGSSNSFGLSASSMQARRNARRQRQIVIGLAVVAAITLLLSFVHGLGFLLGVHAAVDVCLALYLVALVRRKHGVAGQNSPIRHERAFQRAFVAPTGYDDRASSYRRAVGE